MKALIKPNIDLEGYEKLYKFLREKWLLRWSANEIKTGTKKLDGNTKNRIISRLSTFRKAPVNKWAFIFARTGLIRRRI